MARLTVRPFNILNNHQSCLFTKAARVRHFAMCTSAAGRNHLSIEHTPPSTRFDGNKHGHFQHRSRLLKNIPASLGMTSHLSVAHMSMFGYSETDLLTMGVDQNTQQSAMLSLTQIMYHKFRPFMSRETWCVDMAARYLENIHHYTGLPWWATIITATIFTNAMVQIPLRVIQGRSDGRRFEHKDELKHQLRKIEMEVQDAYLQKKFRSGREAKSYEMAEKREIQNAFYEKYNCSPIKNITPVIANILVFYSFSFGLRDLLGFFPGDVMMGHHNFFHASQASFASGGALWFPDLTTPDKSRYLGMIMGTSAIVTGEIRNTLRGSVKELAEKEKLSKFDKNLQYAMRGFLRLTTVWMFYISGYVPSGLALYWATSNIFNLCFGLFAETPTFRKIFKIKKGPVSSDTPFQHIANKSRLRFNKIFKIGQKKV